METHTPHRGRLIDHLPTGGERPDRQRALYRAILATLDVPIGGAGEGYFWADELFVTSIDSPAALGALTGRHHLAFQAQDRATVDRFYQAALAHGGQDNGAPASEPITPAITPPLSSIRTAIISKRFITARQAQRGVGGDHFLATLFHTFSNLDPHLGASSQL